VLSLRPNGGSAESVAVACPLVAIESAQAADNMAWKRTVWWISRLTSGIDAPDDLPSRLAAPAGGPGRRAGELRRGPGTAGAPGSAGDQVERDVVLGLAQRDHRGATADILISAGSSGDRRVELLRRPYATATQRYSAYAASLARWISSCLMAIRWRAEGSAAGVAWRMT